VRARLSLLSTFLSIPHSFFHLSPPSLLTSLFRTYLTGKQYHRRLTDGWRTFCTAQGLTLGDAVHFWRSVRDDAGPLARGPAGEPPALVLRVRVMRRAAAS
jgi:hypothetical protein